ncbi:UNVERIFIED_CONTAM: hypothetical protein Sradi_0457100 [Sesamum radiatum]|uniref:DUF4283 domain-containing protein n=1 Tax=Sesamum radiatum TaxID=300843 RepID=A0AAW2WB72_SESRA
MLGSSQAQPSSVPAPIKATVEGGQHAPPDSVNATAAAHSAMAAAMHTGKTQAADGPYFVYGRPLQLKNMPDCFEIKEDDISVTPVWAILPSLPLECWHPNALGKIGSRLGTPIAMDSLTMMMERVLYARILLEVDASKKLMDQVEFILSNGVISKQRVIYEFTPKFCSECHRFGHLNDSCQGSQLLAVAAGTATAATVNTITPKKAQTSEWTVVQRRNKNQKYMQKQQPSPAVTDEQGDQRQS